MNKNNNVLNLSTKSFKKQKKTISGVKTGTLYYTFRDSRNVESFFKTILFPVGMIDIATSKMIYREETRTVTLSPSQRVTSAKCQYSTNGEYQNSQINIFDHYVEYVLEGGWRDYKGHRWTGEVNYTIEYEEEVDDVVAGREDHLSLETDSDDLILKILDKINHASKDFALTNN